jgi:acid phosphatase (class A)
MDRRVLLHPVAGLTACALAAAIAGCAAAPAASSPMAAGSRRDGYLAQPTALHMTEVLPAAPQRGSPRYEADRQVFLATRKLEGSPRWALATGDVKLDVPSMLKDFSCAMGVSMESARLPKLSAMLEKVDADGVAITEPAKQANHRQRPFLLDDGPVCQSKDKLAQSFDYPSGHATWGWTVGVLLSELVPDRATELMLRGRAYGESRVVCGAHNLSAVLAGQANAAAIVARLHAEPAFEADMAAARKELDALRAAGAPVDGAQCAAERAVIEATPY